MGTVVTVVLHLRLLHIIVSDYTKWTSFDASTVLMGIKPVWLHGILHIGVFDYKNDDVWLKGGQFGSDKTYMKLWLFVFGSVPLASQSVWRERPPHPSCHMFYACEWFIDYSARQRPLCAQNACFVPTRFWNRDPGAGFNTPIWACKINVLLKKQISLIGCSDLIQPRISGQIPWINDRIASNTVYIVIIQANIGKSKIGRTRP